MLSNLYIFLARGDLVIDPTKFPALVSAFQRYCVDLANLKIVGKYDFYKVPPPHRLWIWEEDVEKAKDDLGLVE
jgi:hypothetical protein